MPNRIALLLALPLAIACPRDTWDAAARAELLRRGALDQAIRDTFVASLRQFGRPDSAVSRRMLGLDSANARWLRSAIGSRGWPRPSVVGRDVAEAAFLVAQHATHVPEFQAQVLELLMPLVTTGEVSGQDFALLSDRVAVHTGRLQLYGTQAKIRDGRVVLDPIADSFHVDVRRARLGLPPLAVYVHLLDSMYVRHPHP